MGGGGVRGSRVGEEGRGGGGANLRSRDRNKFDGESTRLLREKNGVRSWGED